MDGGAGRYVATFGQESSTAAVNNSVLVRFRLEAGDQITGVAFTPIV